MSPKQWLALLCFFVSYLFFGASIFYHIEHDLETERREVNRRQRIEMHDLIVTYAPANSTHVEDLYAIVNELCNDDLHMLAPIKPYQWTFYHAFFFAFTVCSTIGYGNTSPTTPLSKWICMLYALIGMPVNGFLFAGLGDFFGRTFVGIYNRYKVYKIATTKNYMPMRFTMIGRIVMYLIPGLVFFIFIPSFVFTYVEDWSYSDAIYYSFITLTTIGFGDYVATFGAQSPVEFGVLFYFYEIFVILWFIFGLGYLVMILGFIAKGMRSKRITRLEHQLANNIRVTQQRIWHGVTKDVGYLRRILNELYLMKFKPVYRDDHIDRPQNLHRSSSCPDLLMYRSDNDNMGTIPSHYRRRAVSVAYYDEDATTTDANGTAVAGRRSPSMIRIQSDSDLNRIDRQRTFEVADGDTSFGNEHILAKVVSALGAIRPTDTDDHLRLHGYDIDGHSVLDMACDGGGSGGGVGGVHGFADADILASEYVSSGWTPNQSGDATDSYRNSPKYRRARAASVFCVPTGNRGGLPRNGSTGGGLDSASNELTWNGNNAAQMQEFLGGGKTKPRKNSLFRNVFANTAGSIGGSTEKMNPKKRTQSVSITIQTPTSSMPDISAGGSSALSQSPAQNTTPSSSSMFTKLNPFRRRVFGAEPVHRDSLSGLDELTPAQYLERTTRGRASQAVPFGPRQYLQATARGRKSAFSILGAADPVNDDVLETTTIADLIRALEVVHTSVQQQQRDTGPTGGAAGIEVPRRKMGLASLTPPSRLSPPTAVRRAGVANLAVSGQRRGSLRPQPAYTTIYNSKLQQQQLERQQHQQRLRQFSGEMASGTSTPTFQQQPNIDASTDPPPYDAGSESTTQQSTPTSRRFSVRPVHLQSAVQRKVSMKPSPLARGGSGQSSVRFVRGDVAATDEGSDSPWLERRRQQQLLQQQQLQQQQQQQQGGIGAASGRNVLWHGSVTELNDESSERKRSDSK